MALRVILDENNDFPPGGPKLGGGIESARTGLQAAFSIQQGEWGYDKTFGMPWRGTVLRKFFQPTVTRAVSANTANLISDIERVTPAQITLDTTTYAAERQVDITIDNVTVGDESETISFTTSF